MFEPRGHFDMYGVIPVIPDHPDAHMAVLFMHNEGYSTMCGHAVIALARYAIDKGLVNPVGPECQVNIQCPCGLIKAYVEISTGRGAFYAIVAANQFGLDVRNSKTSDLVNAANQVSNAIKSQITITHPDNTDLGYLYGTILTDGNDTYSNQATANICVFANSQVDRSPTGSGVTARIAIQHRN
jgi:trans-L-3-hydroxyproline dehydratase